MALTRKQLQACEAFERDWDPRLGGPGTIEMRLILAFVAQRLQMAGAERAAVIEYLGACWELADRLDELEEGGTT